MKSERRCGLSVQHTVDIEPRRSLFPLLVVFALTSGRVDSDRKTSWFEVRICGGLISSSFRGGRQADSARSYRTYPDRLEAPRDCGRLHELNTPKLLIPSHYGCRNELTASFTQTVSLVLNYYRICSLSLI